MGPCAVTDDFRPDTGGSCDGVSVYRLRPAAAGTGVGLSPPPCTGKRAVAAAVANDLTVGDGRCEIVRIIFMKLFCG